MRALFVLVALFGVGCQAATGASEPCVRDSQCPSGLVCAIGRCRTRCRVTRDCDVGEQCLVEPATGISACSIERVDACTGETCPAGFVCHADRCVNLCERIAACPDGVCTDGRCVAVRDADAAVADADAGADAGPVPDANGPDVDAGSGCHGPACDPIVQLDGSDLAMMAVTRGGELWAWGQTASIGLLGDGLDDHGDCYQCSAAPVRVLAADGGPLTGVVEVETEGLHACVRRGDGTVWCWGSVGLGSPTDMSRVPVQVLADEPSGPAPITDATELAVARDSACVIRGAAHEAWCWGRGANGTLGTGSTTDARFATRATELPAPIVAIAAADAHLVALTGDGRVLGLGLDECRALGGATSGEVHVHAVSVAVPPARALAVNRLGTCSLSTADGALSCWGFAPILGLPATPDTCTACLGPPDWPCTAPVALPLAVTPPYTWLGGGSRGIYMGLTADGSLYGWGTWGTSDELILDGAGAPVRVALPGDPPFGGAASGAGLCVFTRAGDVYCGGDNTHGELGRGMATGWEHTLATVVWP